MASRRPIRPFSFGYSASRLLGPHMYRVVQKKGTVLLSNSLAWPAVAGCSRAKTFSQLSAIYFAQPCSLVFNGRQLFQLFVVELGTCIVREMLMVPSDVLSATKLPSFRALDL